jgi:flavin-dependent dehydrogenase
VSSGAGRGHQPGMQAASVFDVAVIGAGPAGAATALELARRGREVVLLERTRFDGPRFGETLPPEINPLLRALGAWDAFLATGPLESPGTISAWGSPVPSEADFVANPFGCGWHVDRNAFDAMLCDLAASAGVRVLTGTGVSSCRRDPDGYWTLRTAADSGPAVRARFVVDASGRNGVRMNETDGRIIDDALVAVFLQFAHDGEPPADARTLVEAAPDGWWYCAPLPTGRTIAAFVVEPDFYVDEGIGLAEQLERAPLACARVGRAHLLRSDTVHISSSIRKRAAGAGWAAVGDAAASYDPLSGYGITKALQDATALAAAIERDDISPYADGVQRAFSAYVRQKRAYYASERRWFDQPFWKRRRVEARQTP